jgi:hypothetical protein
VRNKLKTFLGLDLYIFLDLELELADSGGDDPGGVVLELQEVGGGVHEEWLSSKVVVCVASDGLDGDEPHHHGKAQGIVPHLHVLRGISERPPRHFNLQQL